MRTVILDPASVGLDELLEHRRRCGLDRLAEEKLSEGAYRAVERSSLIDLGASELAGRLDWPAAP